MTIHRIKIFDGNNVLKKIISEEEASDHFYRDAAPCKTIRNYIAHAPPDFKKSCQFCNTVFMTHLKHMKYCRDGQCALKRERERRTRQYAKEKAMGVK